MKIGDNWVSLNALQTFQVAARHQHMGRAATELNVTQSAVSHQVRALETSLGVTLFDRRGRRIELNPAGERLLRAIEQGFAGIASTALSLSTDAFSGQLSLAVPVSLMVEWLNPKLAEFLGRFPGLSLKLTYAERTMTTLPAEDVAAILGKPVIETQPPAATTDATNPAPVAGLTAEERDVIAEAVRDEIRPLRREIAAYKEKNDLQTILGGLGYILGLFGLGFYIAARRKMAV